MKTMKIIIIILLFVPIIPIQSHPYWNEYPMEMNVYEFTIPGFDSYYQPFAAQSAVSHLYLRSEITLKNNLLFANSDEPDGWLDLPYGGVENALKIPIDNGLGILIILLLGYTVWFFRRKQESPKRS